MRRRLFDGPDQGLGEDVQLIEGLPCPTRDRGAHSLVVCLQIALQAAGRPVPYGELMARTGAAFELSLRGVFAAPEAQPDGADATKRAQEALREMGFAAPSPEESDLTEAVKRELAAGRPALALGWGSHPAEWALIVGRREADWLGLCFGANSRLERLPAEARSVVLVGPRGQGLAEGAARERIVERATALLQRGRGEWAAWLEALSSPQPYGAGPGQEERFFAEQWLSNRLDEARSAAAEYLNQLRDSAEDEGWEAEAYGWAERLVERTDRLLAPPEVVGRAHLTEDPDWLQERQATIEELSDLEAGLLAALRRRLSGG